jgi:hypothetical protein
MKSCWMSKTLAMDTPLKGSYEFFLASDVRKEIAILNQKHKEDVNDWLAKFEAVTETNNKEIELRKRWFEQETSDVYHSLGKPNVWRWSNDEVCDKTEEFIKKKFRLVFTKPISEIEKEVKQ